MHWNSGQFVWKEILQRFVYLRLYHYQSIQGFLRAYLKITNAANGDGTVDEFVVVPFLDGTDPTTPPVRIFILNIMWMTSNAHSTE
jgi:hypothetical protein